MGNIDALPEDDTAALLRIFAQLQTHTGHDFTNYKRSTILRRIGHRLQVTQIKDIPAYQLYLSENPSEINELFKDFLVSVTNFFRDPDAFEALATHVLPVLFERKASHAPIHVWVPGCATGEEAYSIALLLHEYAERAGIHPDVRVFATDIDEKALAFGRAGLYPHSIAADVPPPKLKRFFKKEDGGYRVITELRESVLFAVHNLIKDPPISQLDLLSCRNVLIYLSRDVQNKMFEIFHYALRTDGYLLLGSSESADTRESLFTTLSHKEYLYQRRSSPHTAQAYSFLAATHPTIETSTKQLQAKKEQPQGLEEELQSLNEELVTVNQELKHKIDELSRANSDLQNLIASTNIGTIFLDRELRVQLFTPAAVTLFNVIHADIGRPFAHIFHKFSESLVERAQRVLEHLESFEEMLQSSDNRWYIMRMFPYRTVEDRINGVVITFIDVTQLKQTEQELRRRVQQQMTVAALGQRALERIGLQQLLDEAVQSVQQTLGVDYCKVLQLRPEHDDLLLRAGVGWRNGYVGRATVGTNCDSQAGYTLDSAEPIIVEDLADETRFSAPPLLVEHNVVSGISLVIPGLQRPYGVLGIHHTKPRKFSQEDAHFLSSIATLLAESIERRSHERKLAFHAKLLSNVQDAVIATDPDLKVTAWNRGAEIMYGWMEEEALGRTVSTLIRSELSEKERQESLAVLVADGTYRSELITHHRSGREIYTEALTTVLSNSNGEIEGYLSINRDVTKRNQAEEAQRESQAQLRALAASLEERVSQRTAELAHAVEELDRFAYIASHDLRTPLRAIDNLATWIEEDSGSQLKEASHGHLQTIRQRIRRMENLLNDLLAYSRIDRNLQEMEVVNTAELIENIMDVVPLPPHITLEVQEPMPTLLTDHAPLELVLRNLIDNAIKHHWNTADHDQGHIWVSAQEVGDFWEFTVADDGPGIAPRFHERIFQMFRTLQPRDQIEGSGMGLSFVAKIVEDRGGQVSVESEEEKGATFRFAWPHRKV